MRVATLAGTAALLLSTTALAQDITYDYDKAADFAAVKTYAWTDGHNLKDELNHKRIVNAVDAQLSAKGLRKAEPGETPDVFVAYHAGVRQGDFQISGTGGGPYRPARWGTARVEQVTVGVLAVEIINPTGDAMWRGVATKDLDPNASPEKREKNINKAAEKLFKKYPPTN
jgi:hypothetical protein